MQSLLNDCLNQLNKREINWFFYTSALIMHPDRLIIHYLSSRTLFVIHDTMTDTICHSCNHVECSRYFNRDNLRPRWTTLTSCVTDWATDFITHDRRDTHVRVRSGKRNGVLDFRSAQSRLFALGCCWTHLWMTLRGWTDLISYENYRPFYR